MDGYWEDFNASIQYMSSSVGEILSNIHIDTSKIEEAGDMIKKACDEVNEGLKKMKSGLDVINGAVSNIHQNLTDMNTGMKQAQAGLNKANNGMSVANSAIDQAKKAHDTLQKYLKDPIKIKKETRGSELPKLKSLGFDFDFSSYLTLENVSVAIDLIPIVGNIKAGGEVISGYDPITGVRLEGPDYVLGIIGIIVGGEFKQVGKIAGKATELEAKANKITKSMVTETKGTAEGIFKPISSTGVGDHLRRTYDIKGINVRINSGHGYNRSHRTGSVQDFGSMDEIERSILTDVESLINTGTSLPTKNTLQRTVLVNGNNVGYDVMKLKDGTISISTYYPK